MKTGKMLSRASKRLGVRSVTKSKKKNWDEYFTFGFVRHPYSHFLSVYLYLKKHKVVTLDFASYAAQQKETGYSALSDWNFKGLYERISDPAGNIMVDFVGRFENLSEDWSYVTAKIGLPGLQLQYINQTAGSEMRLSDYYAALERKIVQDLYRQDFEMLGYEF